VQLASLGTYRPGPGAAQRAEAELLSRVRTPLDGCRRIAVISRKGGVGKTTTTLMLGHALAQHRGDRVVALDGNPDAGSLGYRVPRESGATITDLLDQGTRIDGYAQMRRFTSQSPSRLEVVASDDDPHISSAIGEEEYREAIAVLERHYNLILLDTGTGILDSATQGILRMADQLVVVLSPSLDSSRAAGLTLDWLESHGYMGLVAGSVAVVNQAHNRGLVEVLRVEDHFRARCREVVRIPWDRHLEAGGEAALDEVETATRTAYLQLAAAVADGFAAAEPAT
jgi:putative peptide zinc metalloprotease protein